MLHLKMSAGNACSTLMGSTATRSAVPPLHSTPPCHAARRHGKARLITLHSDRTASSIGECVFQRYKKMNVCLRELEPEEEMAAQGVVVGRRTQIAKNEEAATRYVANRPKPRPHGVGAKRRKKGAGVRG